MVCPNRRFDGSLGSTTMCSLGAHWKIKDPKRRGKLMGVYFSAVVESQSAAGLEVVSPCLKSGFLEFDRARKRQHINLNLSQCLRTCCPVVFT